VRQLRALIGAAVTFSLILSFGSTPMASATPAPPPPPSGSAPQSATQCPTNDLGTDTTARDLCFDGANVHARGRLTPGPGCLQARPPYPYIYRMAECGGSGDGIEYIAQARALSYLTDRVDPGRLESRGGITPDLQWELSLAGTQLRHDIDVYDHTVVDGPVDVIEAKVTFRGKYKGAPKQLANYVAMLRGIGVLARPGVVLNGYDDVFEQYTDVKKCQDGARRVATYHAYMDPAAPGILRVDKRKQTRCEDNSTDPDNADGAGSESGDHSRRPPIFIPGVNRDGDDNTPNDGPTPTPVGQPAPAPVGAGNESIPECNWICIDDDGVSFGLPDGSIDQFNEWMERQGRWYKDAWDGVGWFAKNVWEGMNITAHDLATALGDPHLSTVDGLHYDMQSVGEFDFAHSARYGMDIQLRFTPHTNWSGADQAAIRIRDHTVQFGQDGSMLLDGQPYDIAMNGMLLLYGNAGILHLQHGSLTRYVVVFPGPGLRPIFTWQPGPVSAAVNLYYPKSPDSDLTGLVGNGNADPGDDLKLRDGTQLPANASPALLDGSYADSWRVTDATSLFTYSGGQSTGTYTDRSFPPNVVTIHTLSPTEFSLGSQACADAGVGAGPRFDDCVVDVALTQNTDFAATAAERATVAVDPSAVSTSTAGNLSADFEGDPLPTNLLPGRVTADPATTRFAGPFSGRDTYRFYVPALPKHLTGQLSFDLVAAGNWGSDADTEQVSVDLDRTQVWTQAFAPGAVTPVRTGTLAGGQPFAVYRVTIPITHSAEQLEAVVRATGVDGLAGQGFGVDNLSLHLDVVPPQVFNTSLPLTVSSNSPGAGAGNLETAAAEDQYTFTLTARGSVFVDARTCQDSVYLAWKLVSDTTGKAVGSANLCSDKQVDDLPAGPYRLVVDPDGGHIGTYALSVIAVPPPQSFNVGLPFTVSNGSPGAGAGNLETVASQDQYVFTVESGQSIYVDAQTCISSIYLAWKLVDSGGHPVAAANLCSDGQVDSPPPGQYRLTVAPDLGHTGGYGLAVFVVPAPQVFDVNLPATVSNGVPAAGAGNLETKASQDQYRFSVPAGQSVAVDDTSCLGTTYLAWSIVNDVTGAPVLSSSLCTDRQTPLPAGTYRLVVTPDQEHTGGYALTIQLVPPPQVFQVTALPLTISNGVPAAGAGNLETPTAQDQYVFSVSSGQSLYLDAQTCISSIFLAWNLLNDTTGAVVGSSTLCTDKEVDGLPAGTYRLVVLADQGHAGTYGMQVITVPQPQAFNVMLPATISNGVPGAGAGNLETKASKDVYTFGITSGQSVYVDDQTCFGSVFFAWTLVSVSSGATVASSTLCTDMRVDGLAPGSYRLVVSPDQEHIGTYGLQIVVAPPAQVFPVTLPVAVSNGVPAAGAGNLEAKGSRDEYPFTLTATRTVTVDVQTCPGGSSFLNWSLVNDTTKASVRSGGCADATITALPAGSYRLLVTPGSEHTGTYSLGLSAT
jgi:hypothetical protein